MTNWYYQFSIWIYFLVVKLQREEREREESIQLNKELDVKSCWVLKYILIPVILKMWSENLKKSVSARGYRPSLKASKGWIIYVTAKGLGKLLYHQNVDGIF